MENENEKVEKWRVIPSFPNYEASTEGRIRNKSKKIMGTYDIKNPTRIKAGLPLYRITTLWCPVKKVNINKYVHVLIAETFLDYRCEGRKGRVYEIDHINDLPYDNRVCNLRITTRRMNQQKAARKRRESEGQEITEPNIYKKGDFFIVKLASRINGKVKTIISKPFESVEDAAKWRDFKSHELDALDKFLGEWRGVMPYDEQKMGNDQ